LHQVGTSSLLIYMMHGHTYIKYVIIIICSSLSLWKIRSNLTKCIYLHTYIYESLSSSKITLLNTAKEWHSVLCHN